ncbi:MAG: cardiolipin synthase [Methanomassiliicoccales archaeon]
MFDLYQVWALVGDLWWLFLMANAIAVLITIVFVQKKRPESVLLWLLAFIVLPLVFVLIFYILLGRDHRNRRRFREKAQMDREVELALASLKGDWFAVDLSKKGLGENESLARLLYNSNRSSLTTDNEVKYYNEGGPLFEDMLRSIQEAKRFVHMEFYIIRKDELSKRFAEALEAKAREGVEVKLLMDAVGCHKLPRHYFQGLREAGGRTAEFFPSPLRRINLRINNRNHRKLLVVDGDVAYIGGYNIGMEYTGRGELGYWRDCMVRVEGSGAIGAEMRFILDWNFAARDKLRVQDYAPSSPGKGKAGLQVVSSGPDTESKAIEEQYLKMILSAKEYVYIQTPYFVPSEPIICALITAAKSGVDTRVMMPSKPDHPFVYWASLYNAGEVLRHGVRVHQFDKNGFIHSKLVVSDDRVVSIGSANFDRRSFELNFETNAVIYDKDLALQVKDSYIDDISAKCTELTLQDYEKRGLRVRFMESISRLYTPIA